MEHNQAKFTSELLLPHDTTITAVLLFWMKIITEQTPITMTERHMRIAGFNRSLVQSSFFLCGRQPKYVALLSREQWAVNLPVTVACAIVTK